MAELVKLAPVVGDVIAGLALAVVGAAVAVLAVVLYLLPTIVARRRAHKDAAAILLLTLLLGWFPPVWLGALVWALTGRSAVSGAVAVR